MEQETQHAPRKTNKLYRFAFARMTTIALLALLCAGLFVSLTNDMYAFVKQEQTVTLSLEEPLTLPELSKALKRNGVVNNPTVFSLYVKSKGQAERLERFCGTLELTTAMSYREILLTFPN